MPLLRQKKSMRISSRRVYLLGYQHVLDAKGNLVAITIEHADGHANLPDLFYEQVGGPEPQSLLHGKA